MEKALKEQRSKLQAEAAKQSKYHNVPTERSAEDGKTIKFDSQKEARRFDELMVLLNIGEIRDLRLQHEFTLQGAYTLPNGNRVKAIKYIADFTYYRGGDFIVEDVKGGNATKTRVYSMKRKMMLDKFGIEITEV